MSTHASTLPLPAWRGVLEVVASWFGRRRSHGGEAADAAAVARQLAGVRALADRYRRSDPGFASDLYAAADRYERTFDREN